MKRVITYGTFDLLHYGHINLLRRAKEYGDYLIVVLSTDEFNWREKHKKCYFTYEKRKMLLESIRYVDLVIPEENWEQKRSDMHEYHIDTFVMGDDWQGKFDFLREEGVDVVYLPRTPEISTTQIKNDLQHKENGKVGGRRAMTASIRVLHVLNALNRGGSESMIMSYYRAIDRSRVQFDFVVHTPEPGAFADEVRALGGHIYYVPKFHGYNLPACLRAWHHIFHTATADRIVQGHMPSTAGLYLGLARLYGRYAIIHAHSVDVPGMEGRLRHICRRIVYVIARHTAQQFYGCSEAAGISRYGERIVKSSDFAVWYNAIDYDRFQYDAGQRAAVRTRLGISQDATVIGCVGRLVPMKNHAFLLDVFAKYHARHPESHLLLVGDGDLRHEIENRIAALGLEEYVHLTGVVPDPEHYMSAMDIHLLVSHTEGLPIVNIEAQANGLPCLISEHVTREVALVPDEVEFLPIDSPDVWVDALERYLPRERHGSANMPDTYDIRRAARWAMEEYERMARETGERQ